MKRYTGTWSSMLAVFERNYDSLPYRLQDEVYIRCQSMEFGELVGLVNERLCVQLSEMFQHLSDLDSGDTPVEAVIPTLPEADVTAAERPSIGPSTHTNPLMTMEMRAKLSAGSEVGVFAPLCNPFVLLTPPQHRKRTPK